MFEKQLKVRVASRIPNVKWDRGQILDFGVCFLKSIDSSQNHNLAAAVAKLEFWYIMKNDS